MHLTLSQHCYLWCRITSGRMKIIIFGPICMQNSAEAVITFSPPAAVSHPRRNLHKRNGGRRRATAEKPFNAPMFLHISVPHSFQNKTGKRLSATYFTCCPTCCLAFLTLLSCHDDALSLSSLASLKTVRKTSRPPPLLPSTVSAIISQTGCQSCGGGSLHALCHCCGD